MKLKIINSRNKLPTQKKKPLTSNYRKKFRSQFGRKPVLKAISILKEKKKKNDCPSCSYPKKVKRIGTGRFYCTKCHVEFSSDSFLFIPIKNTKTESL